MIILRFFFSLQILYFTLFIFSGIFWMSIIVFNFVLLPSLEFLTHVIVGGSTTHSAVWGLVGPLLSWTFNALWILPLFVLSKVVNSLWFQDIADQAYKRSRGRPQTFPSLGKALADILFSLLLQSFFLIQGMLASLLPLPGIGYFVSQFICAYFILCMHSSILGTTEDGRFINDWPILRVAGLTLSDSDFHWPS